MLISWQRLFQKLALLTKQKKALTFFRMMWKLTTVKLYSWSRNFMLTPTKLGLPTIYNDFKQLEFQDFFILFSFAVQFCVILCFPKQIIMIVMKFLSQSSHCCSKCLTAKATKFLVGMKKSFFNGESSWRSPRKWRSRSSKPESSKPIQK